MENELALVETREAAPAAFMPVMDIDQAMQRWDTIREFVSRIMVAGEDFGTIPGSKKPALLKPGAEKLSSFFGLSPEFDVTERIEDWDGINHGAEPFFAYEVKCRLIRDGIVRGEGIGSCNSREAKYRWRESQRVCPKCGKDTIIAGKEEFGGGFLCWKKKGGCGAKFSEDDKAITGQPTGRVPNPDIADVVNTILKMAMKRAHVAAVLSTTGASQYYTQDLEDSEPQDRGGWEDSGSKAAAAAVRDRRIAELQAQQDTGPGADARKLIAAFADLKQKLYVATNGHHDAYYQALGPYQHANELVHQPKTEAEKVYWRLVAALKAAQMHNQDADSYQGDLRDEQ